MNLLRTLILILVVVEFFWFFVCVTVVPFHYAAYVGVFL